MKSKIGSVRALLAPAKVNLSLYVVGKRDDGYHDLVTHMQKLDLYDEITLKITEETGIRLFCEDENVPCDSTNLAFKAAQAYAHKSTRVGEQGIDVLLVKKIPVAAGLGGGSSDAGTVLLGLNEIFDNEFTEAELIEMATPLGADVPFFATQMAAVCATGIGERMTPVPTAVGLDFVLVNPGFPVSTKDVFERFSEAHKTACLKIPASFNTLDLNQLCNDLEGVTLEMHPEIGRIKKSLQEYGASVTLMAGSGPTVFGAFERGEVAHNFDHICESLACEYGKKIFVAKAI